MLFAQQVSVNYNHNANFSQYHTYAWGSDDKNKIRNSILAQVAQQDIESAMQQKGLQKVLDCTPCSTYWMTERCHSRFRQLGRYDMKTVLEMYAYGKNAPALTRLRLA